ncbi:hypothetical protein [Pseudomonas caspiana]|uniref:hypothetical protein n=1 Tax=Pseudomonas caspiana TaxID=1451454 RepID=UPI00130253DB|nr:hypothetical protein [Pseudomonas caspiana]
MFLRIVVFSATSVARRSRIALRILVGCRANLKAKFFCSRFYAPAGKQTNGYDAGENS